VPIREPHEHAALAGVRVLELTDEAGQLCGKLLADMGADVIKVEPPGGSSTRHIGPYRGEDAAIDGSLTFWHYNTSKRSVTLDLTAAESRQTIHDLVAGSDVVIESLPAATLAALGLEYDNLGAANPNLVVCSISPFGRGGPWASFEATDIVHLALGGIMASTGYDTVPGAPPIAPTGGQSWHIAGYFAALGICVAVLHCKRGGAGQHIDVAVHDCVAVTTEMAFHFYEYNNAVVRRQTGRHALPYATPRQNFRTRDGHFINAMLVYLDTRKWLDLVAWLSETGDAQDLGDDIYLVPEILAERLHHVANVVEEFIAKRDLDFLYHGAQKRKLAWTPIRAVEDLQNDPHLADDRGFFALVDHPELNTQYPYIGAPAKFSRSYWEIRGRAPLLGEDNQTVLANRGAKSDGGS
jgi:benzylsuccinate CoA-transferase BbsE subunit